MIREFTCIICPNGCDLAAEIEDGKVVNVERAQCKKGIEYAAGEITNPMRTIASSVAVEHGTMPLASVRLSKAVPKDLIFPIMREIDKVRLSAPTHIGDIVIHNVCGTDSDVIVTKNVGRAEANEKGSMVRRCFHHGDA